VQPLCGEWHMTPSVETVPIGLAEHGNEGNKRRRRWRKVDRCSSSLPTALSDTVRSRREPKLDLIPYPIPVSDLVPYPILSCIGRCNRRSIRPFSRDAERVTPTLSPLPLRIQRGKNALRYEFVGGVGIFGRRFPATNSPRRG